MKIGILTYHRAENYGALLQSYAMMTYLRSLGHDVSFVDYWPKYHSDYFRLFPWQQFKKRHHYRKVIFVIQLILWVIPRYIRKKRLQRFMYEKLGLPKTPLYTKDDSVTEKYDVVIYGSDQIWRKQNLGGVEFDDWYFGSDNIRADRKIAYAGSMGAIDTTIDNDKYIKQKMTNFNSISVREKDLLLYLERLGVSASLVLDPVFLLSRGQWSSIVKKTDSNKGKYILFYNLLDTQESVNFTKRLSRDKQLPVKEINKKMSPLHTGKGYIKTASVERFLQLIVNAEYVVSNSFHGVALSIIFQKKIYVVGMGKKASRVCSLLESLDMKELYSETGDNVLDLGIDYKTVEKKLLQLRNKSCCFIRKSLSRE